MKKFLTAAVMILATSAFSQSTPASTAGTQQSGAPAQQKTIKDPAEYNSYITATGLTDPTQKAAALESFVQQYPNSVVKEDALEAAMAAYQQANNPAKAADAANRILQVSPNNVSGLVVLVNAKRQAANAGQNAQQNLVDASQLAQRGLAAMQGKTKPDGMSDADFQKRQTIFAVVFHGAIGQAALANKDYPTAQQNLLAAVKDNPNDVGDVYPLAVSYISPKPNTDDNVLNGLWYIARALNLVAGNAAAQQQIGPFGKSVYKRYHGGEDGWPEFVALAKTSPTPPSDLATRIAKAPSPAEQVRTMLQTNPNIETLDFGNWVLIFTYGGQQDKDAAFERIKDKAFKFEGEVISATSDTANIALTQDAIDAKKAEVQVTMQEPFKKVPAPGSKLPFQANPVSYTSDPFLIVMDKGIDLTPAAKTKAKARAKTPVRHTTRKRK